MMHYKFAAASVLACACAGARPAPASAGGTTTPNAPTPAEGTTTQNTVTPSSAQPDSASPDAPIDISKFQHARDDDESQDAVISQGANSRHEPYWREFAEQLFQSWAPPAEKMTQDAAGCFHIVPEGKIAETRLMTPSGDDAIDASITFAMSSMQNARDKHPVLVPTDQLALIRSWVCFKFTAEAQARRPRTRSAPPSR
ncbi:MAG: hypothetical protein E6J90_14240 [Deltaproteobacteria bacterium]|nr:MAG: hypothetical protein E6J90_14240 [Deltaproteobacteria bacterium]